MKKYQLTALLLSTLLIGCAGIGTQFTKMSEPQSGERAQIRVVANMLVKGIPNSACIDWSKEGAGTIFGGIVGSSGYRGRSLGMPNPEGLSSRNSGEFYAVANQPITITLLNTPESRMRCSVSGSFIPVSGKDYQVDLATSEVSDMKSRCAMRVREVTSSGLIPVAIKKASDCQ